MPNINVEYSEEEYKNILGKKLAESKRRGKDLSWKEFVLIAGELVKA